MKEKITILILVFSLYTELKASPEEYKKIDIGLTTTIHLIFNDAIISYDIGLGQVGEYQDILAKKTSSNRLKLAAGIENFNTTNLFVETESAYYNFILSYTEFPQKHILNIATEKAVSFKPKKENSIEALRKDSIKDSNHELNMLCEEIYEKSESSFIVANSTLGVVFQMDNIYVKNDILFFKFSIHNESNVKYEVGYLGYLISEKGKGKKQGVVTDESLSPIYTYQDFQEVGSNENKKLISVFEKFTIEKGKNLIIHLWEKEGQRMVEIKINPKQLINAKILN